MLSELKLRSIFLTFAAELDSSKTGSSKSCWTKFTNIFSSDGDKTKAPKSQQEKETKKVFRNIRYCGRQPLAATSTGSKVQHKREFKKIITDTMGELTDEEMQKMQVSVIAQVKATYPEQPFPYDANAPIEIAEAKPRMNWYAKDEKDAKPSEQSKGQSKDLTARKPEDKSKDKPNDKPADKPKDKK